MPISSLKLRLHHIILFLVCVIVGWFMHSLSAILMPFIAGGIGAYALNTFVTRLQTWGIPRGVATSIVMFIFMMLIGGFLTILIPYLHHELLSIYQNLPLLSDAFLNKAAPFIQDISHHYNLPTLTQIQENLSTHIGDIAQFAIAFMLDLLSRSVIIANLISLFIFTPIVMFYMLKDWPLFLHHAQLLIPRAYIRSVNYYAHRVHTTLSGYVRGQMTVCLILIVLYSIALHIVGLPDALFIGFITGFLAFIPYLGAFIGFVLAMLVSFIHFAGWWKILAITLAFFIVSTLEGNYLTPRFVGKQVGLHPVWIMFSLMAAGSFFGFMGVVIALPVAAVLGTTIRFLIEAYYKSTLYTASHNP